MRKNHHGKNDRLVKRVFALCLALAVICTCLVPVFATEDLSDLQVEKGASQPVDGEGGKEEAAGFGGEEAPRPVDDEGGEEEAAGSDGDSPAVDDSEAAGPDGDSPAVDDSEAAGPDGEEAPRPVDGEGGEDNPGEGGEDNPGEDAVVDMNKEVVSGDEIKKQQDMVVYRFWLKELKALDLQEIAMKAQTDKMTESEYLARNGEVWSLYFIQAVPRAETIADYSSYIKDPSSDQDPTGMLRLFDHWYTLDELGNRVRLDLSDPTSNILDDKTTTVNVYAAWQDGTVGSDEEEDVVHEDLVDENPAPPAPVNLETTAAATYKGEGDNTESVDLPVEVKNLPSAAHSLSVIRMGYDDVGDFYEKHSNDFEGMAPLLGLEISPKNAKGETVQPAEGQAATVTVSDLDKLPEIAAMEEAGVLTAGALKVLHQKDNDTVEKLDVVSYENGTLTFKTTSFSPFVIALTGGYDTELLDERAADRYEPLYLYALKPGLEWDGSQTSTNAYWYGIGIAKIKGKPDTTQDIATIRSYIDNETIVLEPFTGTHKFGGYYSTEYDYGNGKSLYPKIGLDKMSAVDDSKPGYTYWDKNETAPTEPYYTVEWINLGLPYGAPKSGYNEPEVSTDYYVYHLDARITFSDMCNVDFMVKEPNETVFKRLDVTKYSSAHIKGSPESDIVKPEKNGYTTDTFNGYVFDGWYKDEACTIKAEFDGTIVKDTTYYGKYVLKDTIEEDIPYITVEKRITGITVDQIPVNFYVKVGDQTLEFWRATLVQRTDPIILRWTIWNPTPQTYHISEEYAEIDGYTVTPSGDINSDVDVTEAKFTVTQGAIHNSCNDLSLPVGQSGDKDFLFVVSSNGNNGRNIVISKSALSLAQRNAVETVLNNASSTFGNQNASTVFYSIKDKKEVVVDNVRLVYNEATGRITINAKGVWNKAMELSYDITDANNPEVKITNEYTLATADIEVSKLVTGMMGSLEKAFTFQITGLPNTSKVVQNGVENAAGESFTMKSGDSVTLENVPVDTVFAVKEIGTDAKDYQTTATGYTHVTDIQSGESDRVFYYVVRYENGQRVLKPCNEKGENEQTGLDGFRIQVTNHCGLLPDTGVLLDTLPYIVILAVVAGGVALLMLRKRRKEDD